MSSDDLWIDPERLGVSPMDRGRGAATGVQLCSEEVRWRFKDGQRRKKYSHVAQIVLGENAVV